MIAKIFIKLLQGCKDTELIATKFLCKELIAVIIWNSIIVRVLLQLHRQGVIFTCYKIQEKCFSIRFHINAQKAMGIDDIFLLLKSYKIYFVL